MGWSYDNNLQHPFGTVVLIGYKSKAGENGIKGEREIVFKGSTRLIISMLAGVSEPGQRR